MQSILRNYSGIWHFLTAYTSMNLKKKATYREQNSVCSQKLSFKKVSPILIRAYGMEEGRTV